MSWQWRRGARLNLVSVVAHGAEEAADWDNLKSPETYLGSERSENQLSPAALLGLNQWALDGD
jgi:hypothetical protein